MEKTIVKAGLLAAFDNSEDIEEALEEIPVSIGNLNDSAMIFLHGVCGVFALALHDRFGYELDWVLDDEYDGYNPWAHLVHVFCSVADDDGIHAVVDVRGVTDDFELFHEEFADFVDYPGVWVAPPTREKLVKEMINEMGTDDFKAFYERAVRIIEAHPDWYSGMQEEGAET